MKQFIISVIVGCFISTGLSQNQKIDDKSENTENGPKMKQVLVEIDYFNEMSRAAVKTKNESSNSWGAKTAVVKDMEKINSKSKYYSTENVKPQQIIITDGEIQFGQGKEQIYSKKKSRKKVGHVDGIAPREEIKKIYGHSPVSQDVLIQALGNLKSVQAKSGKVKEL